MPLPQHKLLVLQTQLLCEIRTVGVGGTAPEVFSGLGAPTEAPVRPAFYLDKTPDAEIVLYWWNDTAWIPFG